jgi:hypothetical protein
VCIESSPDEFARGDYYEWTYEAQYISVPYAREHGLGIYPVDWFTSRDDLRLALGRIDFPDPSPVRDGFFVLDSVYRNWTLFYADSEPERAKMRAFSDRPRASGLADYARRNYLYRTFMQAMRIRAAALRHRGQTVVVIIGADHKEDIEHVLAPDPDLRVVQPSTYGSPTEREADAELTTADLAAILSYNLLGLQPSNVMNRAWVADVLDRFARANPSAPELPLLRTRYAVLTQDLPPRAAATAYERAAAAVDSAARFMFTGVQDRGRIDSYYDPFGNMPIRERADLEAARG